MIPDPLRLSVFPGLAVTVNPAAPELKTMSLTVVLAETETALILEKPNVAISAGPSGTVRGIQLPAVSQSLLIGLSRQVALPAKLLVADRVASRTAKVTAILAKSFSIVDEEVNLQIWFFG